MTIPSLPPGTAIVRSPAVAPPREMPPPAPAAKPPGLWSMLSRAERMFFEVPEGTGVLGYGPSGSSTEVAPVVGQHLDVKG